VSEGAWLVTGGAGYVGGHVVAALAARGLPVVVLDDLSTGFADRTAGLPGVAVVSGRVHDEELVRRAIREHGVTGVMHLAARKRPDESLLRPRWYRSENVGGLAALLRATAATGVERLVFSSSAAVYGEPAGGPVAEDAPLRPTTPYGETKAEGERLLHRQGGLRWVALRYFNVAGAAAPALADRRPANLVSRVLDALAAGRPPVVNGDRHPTPDGTCVRDYVHVADVADAHLAVLPLLSRPGCAETLNVGCGRGWSVREVVEVARQVTASPVEPVVGPPRPGDPPQVVAAVDRIEALLGWRSRHDLRDMVASAWAARLPAGVGVSGRPRSTSAT
jgi:UDP-glucose 4-epimerase